MTNENYDETIVRVFKNDCWDVGHEFSKEAKAYYKKNDNGKLVLHRTDGPAIEHANGTKLWFINGKCHREDGPAVEYANGNKYWYVDDKHYSTEEKFNQKIQEMNASKIPSCEGKIVEIDGKKYKLQEV